MKRVGLILAALVVVGLFTMPIEAGVDYKALYEQALTDAIAWQDQAFALSAEVGRQKQLTEDALALYEAAERDGDLLRAEIERLATALQERDAIIEVQAMQLKKLMGTERYTWLLAGVIAGAVGGYVVGSPR